MLQPFKGHLGKFRVFILFTNENGLDTLGRFSAIFLKGGNFVTAHFHSYSSGSTLKGKNLLPLGANSFLSELSPFQKGSKQF